MKLIKLGKLTGCTKGIDEDNYLHLPAQVNYATLCGLGEEEYEDESIVEGELDCPDCLQIVDVVRRYLTSASTVKR